MRSEDKLAEMAEYLRIREDVPVHESLPLLSDAFYLGLAQGRAEENEACAKYLFHRLPTDLEVVADEIRSRMSGEEKLR